MRSVYVLGLLINLAAGFSVAHDYDGAMALGQSRGCEALLAQRIDIGVGLLESAREMNDSMDAVGDPELIEALGGVAEATEELGRTLAENDPLELLEQIFPSFEAQAMCLGMMGKELHGSAERLRLAIGRGPYAVDAAMSREALRLRDILEGRIGNADCRCSEVSAVYIALIVDAVIEPLSEDLERSKKLADELGLTKEFAERFLEREAQAFVSTLDTGANALEERSREVWAMSWLAKSEELMTKIAAADATE